MADSIVEIAAALALVALAALLTTKAFLHLFKTFLRPGKELEHYGKWAVVTGATGKLILDVATNNCCKCIVG
jgi:hypothetical protein